MTNFMLVAAGSALGGAARYGCGLALNGVVPVGLPVATFLVNLAGSAAFGYLFGRQHAVALAQPLYLALTTGFLGGFTTYSTFNAELVRMAMANEWGRVAGYAMATMVACFVGGWFGFLIGNRGG